MMNVNEIFSYYGYVIVPKNTLLFWGTRDNRTRGDYKFFASSIDCARNFGREVQVWKVLHEFRVPFLIRSLDHRSFGLSSIPDLYNKLYPNDASLHYNQLDIKLEVKREQFVEGLRKAGCKGWFTTIEDNVLVEICLFSVANFCRKIENPDINNLKTYDSLRKLKLYPSESFFNETEKCLAEFYSRHHPNRLPYSIFRSKIRAHVLDYVELGGEEREGKHFYYSLRQKLKI